MDSDVDITRNNLLNEELIEEIELCNDDIVDDIQQYILQYEALGVVVKKRQ
jgi:hypothetical protein